MAQKANAEGLRICNQFLKPDYIAPEIYVELKPCTNCFGYDHKKDKCEKEIKQRCTQCAGDGHSYRECNERPKCLNCGQAHRTLASICQVRKDIIQKKSKEIRERWRANSKSKSRPRYQEAPTKNPWQTTAGPQRNSKQHEPQASAQQMNQHTTSHPPFTPGTPFLNKNTVETITAAMAHAYIQETYNPGTYKQHAESLLKENGMGHIRVPSSETINQINEAQRKKREEEKRQQQRQHSKQQQEKREAARIDCNQFPMETEED